ncbi:hypothetical protein C942_00172 [Photobacterium marinum]|uniref:Uncharacterized protein n=1 Tax=Photobacterium marinum TaxID=1056511 RepID=L8JK41_9GAMM|nr:hypothetical protein C942_00172 [Photobacterium marinum]
MRSLLVAAFAKGNTKIKLSIRTRLFFALVFVFYVTDVNGK